MQAHKHKPGMSCHILLISSEASILVGTPKIINIKIVKKGLYGSWTQKILGVVELRPYSDQLLFYASKSLNKV